MYNIKGIAVVSDGEMKRLAVTYDELSDDGGIVSSNNKINRVVTDGGAKSAIQKLTEYAQGIIEGA